MEKTIPMVMPWTIPNPNMPPKNQERAAYKQHLIDYRSALDLKSDRAAMVLTSIMCTLGSASKCDDVIIKMIEAGMSSVRIDMSIGTKQEQEDLINNLRESVQKHNEENQRIFPVAVVVDLQGATIYTGNFEKTEINIEMIDLTEGELITLTAHPNWKNKGTKNKLYVDNISLALVLRPKDKIYLDYGRIELIVRGVVDTEIYCVVAIGGELGNHKTVFVPSVALELPVLTYKDKEDLEMAINKKVDAIIVPYVRCSFSVQEVKDQLGDRGKCITLFSKIDTIIGVEHFDEILSMSDGIVIDRGSLSIGLSTEKVFQAQKSMMARCNKMGKPVFIITEFLNSMKRLNCPTFAEISDVEGAVIDGADGLILSDETANGAFPVKTVKTLATICKEAESEIWHREVFLSLLDLTSPPQDPANSVSIGAALIASQSQAAAIIVATTSGSSAMMISKYRPRCPILGVTRYGGVARRLSLIRGVIAVHYIAPPNPCWAKDIDLRHDYAMNIGKTLGFIHSGDPVILINGWRQGSGFTNTIRIVYASIESTKIYPQYSSRGTDIASILSEI